MALGARPGQILAQFLRYGLVWGGTGVAVGLVAAVFAQRWLKEFLYRVQPFDPGTFAAASAGVFLVVLMAIWWPARQASRIKPRSVLRHN